MDPLSTLLFSLQFQLKTLNVLHVILLFANFLVPKLYMCLVFHTLLGLYFDFFQDVTLLENLFFLLTNLIKKMSNLNRHKKDHFIILDKSILTYLL